MPLEIRVRGYHTDAYGHVNHARYLEFFEEARWTFFENSGLPLANGLQLVVTDIRVRYRRAARTGDTLTVRSRIASWESRRIIIEQQADLSDGRTAVTAEITLLPVLNGKSCSLPSDLQTALQQNGRL